jgi:hypothetical protein
MYERAASPAPEGRGSSIARRNRPAFGPDADEALATALRPPRPPLCHAHSCCGARSVDGSAPMIRQPSSPAGREPSRDARGACVMAVAAGLQPELRDAGVMASAVRLDEDVATLGRSAERRASPLLGW